MKHPRYLLLLMALCWSLAASAQAQDEVLFYVNQTPVSKTEFIESFKKNNPGKVPDRPLLRAYLEKYVIYKMKIQDALDLGLPNRPKIKKEIQNFTDQLTQPYLTDRELMERMLRESYQHMRYDVHARQIMVRVVPGASPKDTLDAFRIANRIRERLVRGEDFDLVVREEGTKNGKLTINERRDLDRVSGSDLKYFTVFAMPYPIEQYAFSAETGDFSRPIRTNIGYHVIQVLDRQPAMGKIKASQIFFSVPKNAPKDVISKIKRKADSIYAILIQGGDFEELAREYSDDKVSAIRGGLMSEFNVSHMDADFIRNLYKIDNEIVSRPFAGEVGYHIVKIHSRSGIQTYDQVKAELSVRLSRDERVNLIRESYVRQLLALYKLQEIPGAITEFASLIDSNEILSMWTYLPDERFQKPLFKIGDHTILFDDFAKVVERDQFNYSPATETFENFIRNTYRSLIADQVIAYEASHIQDKFPELKAAVKEYKEGILLYELSNIKIWDRALTDTIGLWDFYDGLKHCYMWPPRINALIFKYDVRKLSTEDVQRFLATAYKKKWVSNKIIEQAALTFEPAYFKIQLGVLEPGQDKFADRIQWDQLGLSQDIAAGGTEKGFVYIYDYYPPSCKALDEIRGTMISEYQKYLENEWIKDIKNTYTVKFNDAVLQSLIQ